MLGRVARPRRRRSIAGVVVSNAIAISIIVEISTMPVRPPIHRPVGRREKRERDQDYARQRNPVARALYRSKRWRTERASFLHDHPLCVECERHDLVRPASVVDHVDPHDGNETVFWDRSRWQALCASCHGRKTAAKDGGFGNALRC
ncbi:5-methylcytosine-specific restriction protein A [Ochrobactrum sp. J50]|uniref:HNH endonuclease n=1 Tax=Ochrobactrum sp. J50 TaxID=936132 RepID=UPI0011ACC564|nr:HNH endonuclease signature motif containing protein [Ochrobactrum sp. J50]TWG97857.1 5-methylcytosine-specific restriction protein A [Ochrobactrum sp. J50]